MLMIYLNMIHMDDYLQEDGVMTLFEQAFYNETCCEYQGNTKVAVNKLKNLNSLKKSSLFFNFIFNYVLHDKAC